MTPLYYKMIMQGSDTTREVRAGCVGDTCIIIKPALQTNRVTESNVKDVIKKILKNAPKWKGGEKTQMM